MEMYPCLGLQAGLCNKGAVESVATIEVHVLERPLLQSPSVNLDLLEVTLKLPHISPKPLERSLKILLKDPQIFADSPFGFAKFGVAPTSGKHVALLGRPIAPQLIPGIGSGRQRVCLHT